MGSGQGVEGIRSAGHRGVVGSAIYRALEAAGEPNVLTAISTELDLRNAAAVDEFFAAKGPTQVYLAAAKGAAYRRTARIRRSSPKTIWRLRTM